MSYKNVYSLVILMAYDNGFVLKQPFEFEDGYNWKLLDDQASKLNPKQWGTVVMGEHTDMENVIYELNIHQLHEFLNDLFDGPAHDIFFTGGIAAYSSLGDVINLILPQKE